MGARVVPAGPHTEVAMAAGDVVSSDGKNGTPVSAEEYQIVVARHDEMVARLSAAGLSKTDVAWISQMMPFDPSIGSGVQASAAQAVLCAVGRGYNYDQLMENFDHLTRQYERVR